MKKWCLTLVLMAIFLPSLANADVIPSRGWPPAKPLRKQPPAKPEKPPNDIPKENPSKKELELIVLLSIIGLICVWKLKNQTGKYLLDNSLHSTTK